ncbi:YbaB/EbfC family nucleoid-associated protein [Amycolatopsis suaedae]|uniref:YbaB/EbfC family DNA-binding protein n=1 Tax=Amycolatopsis suaedae TaxID=2510978 RepID=A0A4Q7J932_9PSEU|nr:YbaB/EbfC family nucleoid-associated protein [Amycolatopsis suaedae]RZQ64250.1 YbaB/EbfC family DNA-binding protein [Amycolatopsis suaedae]
MTAPEQLFADYEAKMQATLAKAEQMRTEIEAVQTTARSQDGQITVTVNHAGNVTDLVIGPTARTKPDLAQQIMRTMQQAQSQLADAMQAGVPSIAGTETMNELVHQMHESYPEPEPQGYVEGGHSAPSESDRFVAEQPDEHPPAPPRPTAPPRPAPPPRPNRAPAAEDHDDDYFNDGGFLDDDEPGGRR